MDGFLANHCLNQVALDDGMGEFLLFGGFSQRSHNFYTQEQGTHKLTCCSVYEWGLLNCQLHCRVLWLVAFYWRISAVSTFISLFLAKKYFPWKIFFFHVQPGSQCSERQVDTESSGYSLSMCLGLLLSVRNLHHPSCLLLLKVLSFVFSRHKLGSDRLTQCSREMVTGPFLKKYFLINVSILNRSPLALHFFHVVVMKLLFTYFTYIQRVSIEMNTNTFSNTTMHLIYFYCYFLFTFLPSTLCVGPSYSSHNLTLNCSS